MLTHSKYFSSFLLLMIMVNPLELVAQKLSKSSETNNGSLLYNGFVYTTIVINDKEWTVENLRTSKYNDGKAIKKLTDLSGNTKLGNPAYWIYDNDESNVEDYGYFYNWEAVNSGKLAPKGWRIPSSKEWEDLKNSLGNNPVNKLKATTGWSYNKNGTDEKGFRALPGGYSHFNENLDIGKVAMWWTSTERGPLTAHTISLDDYFYLQYKQKVNGLSVRLIRDVNQSGEVIDVEQELQNKLRKLQEKEEKSGSLKKYKISEGKIYSSLDYQKVTYKTVIIGNQEWMAENLKTMTYNDDTKAKNSFCLFNKEAKYLNVYGYLYNSDAVFSGKLAPDSGGWRISTEDDWKNLIDSFGDNTIASIKLKAKKGWDTAITKNAGTNESGLNLLPGGYRYSNEDIFFGEGEHAGFWAMSSITDRNQATCSFLSISDFGSVEVSSTHCEDSWFSVRLVRDIDIED
ncbi:MAG: fibrobacter succinogenes major paralogous domain-containing protein [Bacteroidetes bacterium]|nr:fibrobacter succinogenes major paralogous domain-containing protein [Bacteroidota bacterium]